MHAEFGCGMVFYSAALIQTSLLLILSLSSSADGWSTSLPAFPRKSYDYDLIVIGAGASGLFAAGTASSVGFRTLLIERAHNSTGPAGSEEGVEFHVGGDCTNAACVPSKAVRSIAKMAAASRKLGSDNKGLQRNSEGCRWLKLARQHSNEAVEKVRSREDPSRINAGPSLDLEFVRDCHFVSSHEMKLQCYDNSTWLLEEEAASNSNIEDMSIHNRTVSSRKILIATGASPAVPESLSRAAIDAGVPYYTYRSLLRPNSLESLFSTPVDGDESKTPQNIVLVGGGATACELGQTISRLGGDDLNVSIVAHALIPAEDVTLQHAATKVLETDGCNIHLGSRAVDVVTRSDGNSAIGPRLLLNDNTTIPVDCLFFCIGRTPESSLSSLQLNRAGVAWTPDRGVTVNSYLRSKTARHIYASGDCASAVPYRDRRAIHAGWTGFNAVRNALLPWFLRSPAIHEAVPRVIYTDPEIASAGMSDEECVRKYGADGYDNLFVKEKGSDRADVDSAERMTTSNFVELRTERISGRILGASACGPAAAETINEVCLALVNRLTVRDMARTLHSYPSHGYLLYRISMALATQSIPGLLAGCGVVGRILSAQIRCVMRIISVFNLRWLPRRRRALRRLFKWQALGSAKSMVMKSDVGELSLLSFLDAYSNHTLCNRIVSGDDKIRILNGRDDFVKWVDSA